MVETRYRAYLLRLRRVDNGGAPCWLFSLQRPGTDEERQFATLQTLVDFLQAVTDAPDPAPESELTFQRNAREP